jgi:hypothetical protein
MTIQRQYSLPNCTLVLEGLGDSTIVNASDPRPLMSILINAECYLAGQSVSGGREFFESMIVAVSHYAQELLSGIHRFGLLEDKPQLVHLRRIDANRHRLSVQPSQSGQPVDAATPGTEIDLTTVQVFDLVEAVDQFFADAQTLPDLSLQLAPLPKRFMRREEPLTKRAVPIAVGVSSVAVAAIACFWIPVPKINEPVDVLPQPGATATTSTPGASPPVAGSSPNPTPTTPSVAASSSPTTATSPTATPDLENLEAALTSAPEITDPTQLESLRKQLYDQIDNAWKERTPFVQDLVYRVGIGKDGAIVGYKPVNEAALTNANKTPLLNLLYIPTAGIRPESEAIAQFQVKFTPSGLLEVTPWQQAMPSPLTGAPEITDPAILEELVPKLRSQIVQVWREDAGFEFDKELEFLVRVRPDGVVVDYRPHNEAAIAVAQTAPIAKLGKLMPDSDSVSVAKESLAWFKVVLRPNGVPEVSPWRGWKDPQQ